MFKPNMINIRTECGFDIFIMSGSYGAYVHNTRQKMGNACCLPEAPHR